MMPQGLLLESLKAKYFFKKYCTVFRVKQDGGPAGILTLKA